MLIEKNKKKEMDIIKKSKKIKKGDKQLICVVY